MANSRLASAQELVRQCMAKQGFRYLPRRPKPAQPVGSDNFISERNRKLTYGYGIADSFETDRSVFDAETDPNEQIVGSLSSAEKDAYLVAIGGTGDRPGCWRSAFAGDEGTSVLATKVSMIREELGTRYLSDAKVVSIYRMWSRCMKTAGYAVSTPRDVFQVLEPNRQRLLETHSVVGVDNRVKVDKQALADFRRVELSIARSDANCVSPSDADQLTDIHHIYENHAIANNRSVLQSYQTAEKDSSPRS